MTSDEFNERPFDKSNGSDNSRSSCRIRGRLEISEGNLGNGKLSTDGGNVILVGTLANPKKLCWISRKIGPSPRDLFEGCSPRAAPLGNWYFAREKLSSAACISGFRLIFISQRLRTKLVFALGPVTIHPGSTWPLKKRTGAT